MLTEKSLKTIEEIRKRYPAARAALLPVLWIAQEQEGWISEPMMKEIAALLDVPVAHVMGVVSFYTMFNMEKKGKYHIQVCTNVSCQLLGGEKIFEYISKKINCPKGGTTTDGLFSLDEVECLGSCGTAPMMQVNDDYYENLTTESIDTLLARMK